MAFSYYCNPLCGFIESSFRLFIIPGVIPVFKTVLLVGLFLVSKLAFIVRNPLTPTSIFLPAPKSNLTLTFTHTKVELKKFLGIYMSI